MVKPEPRWILTWSKPLGAGGFPVVTAAPAYDQLPAVQTKALFDHGHRTSGDPTGRPPGARQTGEGGPNVRLPVTGRRAG
jgi:hypothetical protein